MIEPFEEGDGKNINKTKKKILAEIKAIKKLLYLSYVIIIILILFLFYLNSKINNDQLIKNSKDIKEALINLQNIQEKQNIVINELNKKIKELQDDKTNEIYKPNSILNNQNVYNDKTTVNTEKFFSKDKKEFTKLLESINDIEIISKYNDEIFLFENEILFAYNIMNKFFALKLIKDYNKNEFIEKIELFFDPNKDGFPEDGLYYIKIKVNKNIDDVSQLILKKEDLVKIDLSHFNADKIINMDLMFYHCSKLKEIIGLNNLITDNVISMNSMFFHCISLTSLDLSNFKTDKVHSMQSMFAYCTNLVSLDI